MSRRRIAVTINPDGSIEAETLGITGETCLEYLPLLEDLLAAETVESAFTADYRAVTSAATGTGTTTETATATETVREHRSS